MWTTTSFQWSTASHHSDQIKHRKLIFSPSNVEAMGTQIMTSDFPNTEVHERYSVFTRNEKWCIAAMVSYAAWFSTVSSFIYYPALELLSKTLSVSVDRINLTVTAYMAVATVAPTLVGDASDTFGRRPLYAITFVLYMAANIAIALSRSYPTLLGLRVLQAMAISGMLYSQNLV